MNIYRIPVRWTMYGVYEVESPSLDTACELIAKASEDYIGLPRQEEYVEGSCYIAKDKIEEENEWEFQRRKKKWTNFLTVLIWARIIMKKRSVITSIT